MPTKLNLAPAINIFISCAEEDDDFLHSLDRQLSSLGREGYIESWHRYKISPGSEWQEIAKKYLGIADIILLLVSPHFVVSDYCYGEEAFFAMERHKSGKSRVIPVILRPLAWEHLVFGRLKSLPTGKAVSMWPNRDAAFTNIVKGIKGAIDDLKSKVRMPVMDKPLSLWNVPYWQNPFFTGREDVLANLQSTFTSPRTLLRIQALSGLAGVGKTQVAVEYAYRYANTYQAVLWVRADAPEILLSSFVELAEVLNLPEKNEASQPVIIRAVKQWLQRSTSWLLIVDNLEDVDLLRDVVPTPNSGHILVTTHAHRTGHMAHRVDLAPMPNNDGALLLLRRAKLLPPVSALSDAAEADGILAKNMAQEVQGLPLALDQAGAYIEETGRGLSDYMSLYQQRSSSLLKRRGVSGQNHPASVTTTFSLSFEKVKAQNPAAIELLEVCAFLHPDAIPEDMIIDGASILPSLLRATVTDPLEFDQTIENLLKFSLVRRESDQHMLIVHRLVQAVVKDTMSKERRYEGIEKTIHIITAVFPSPDFLNWPLCQRYLLQAQACVKLIQQQNVLLPEASQLLRRVGTYLCERGLYDQAEGLLLHASAITEALVSANHPDFILILSALATTYYEQGKYHQVESLLLRSLALSEKLLGAEDVEISESLNTLGRTYHKQGRYNEAEPLLQRALVLRQTVLGLRHPKVAVSLGNLAILYNRQGKYDQAEVLYKQALAIRQATLDPQHPDIGANLNNLAVFYSRLKKYDQAEPLAEQALNIYQKAFGEEHPRFVNVLDTLAEIYQEQGKYSRAEPLYQKIFAVAYKRLGSEHPQLVEYGNHLARLCFLQGKYAEGELTARQVRSLAERVLGPDHHHVATAINTVADICKTQGRYNEAEEFYQQALAIREKVLAPNDIYTAVTLESYSDLLQMMGRDTEAETLRRQAEVIRHEKYQ